MDFPEGPVQRMLSNASATVQGGMIGVLLVYAGAREVYLLETVGDVSTLTRVQAFAEYLSSWGPRRKVYQFPDRLAKAEFPRIFFTLDAHFVPPYDHVGIGKALGMNCAGDLEFRCW